MTSKAEMCICHVPDRGHFYLLMSALRREIQCDTELRLAIVAGM